MRVQMAEATRKQERADAAKLIRGKNYQSKLYTHWYFHTPPMMGMRHEAESSASFRCLDLESGSGVDALDFESHRQVEA